MTTSSLLELAGVSHLRARDYVGLQEHETEQLCRKVNAARLHAGMTPAEFMTMEGSALSKFCAQFAFSFIEVRLAQSLVQVTRAMFRTHVIAYRVARARRNGATHRGTLQ